MSILAFGSNLKKIVHIEDACSRVVSLNELAPQIRAFSALQGTSSVP